MNPQDIINPQISPEFLQILNQNVLKPVSGIVMGLNGAIATNYGNFFVAERSYQVIAISEVHLTAGTVGSPTVSVEKCATGVAPGSGVDLLATAFSLTATVNVPQFGSLTTTKADLILKKGDRLVLKDSGTLTTVADVCVTVLLRSM